MKALHYKIAEHELYIKQSIEYNIISDEGGLMKRYPLRFINYKI